MQIFRNEQRHQTTLKPSKLPAILGLAGTVGIALACSAARLDSKTRAFTFDTPALEGSAAPPRSHRPAPSTAPIPSASSTATSGASTKPPQSQTCSRLPDPKALITTNWVRLNVLYERGKLSLVRAKPEQTRQAEATARKMGRFAAELWIGCELIDRVRFDFPLLGAEPVGKDAKNPHQPNFERQGRFETTLLVPNSERATRLELRDRAYEGQASSVLPLPWPLPSEVTSLVGAPPMP